MASPDTVELRALSDADLRSQLEEGHRALFNLRFQASTRQLADVSQVRATRRNIARLKTLLREREILVAYEARGIDAPVAAATTGAAPATEATLTDEPAEAEAVAAADDTADDDGAASDAEEQE